MFEPNKNNNQNNPALDLSRNPAIHTMEEDLKGGSPKGNYSQSEEPPRDFIKEMSEVPVRNNPPAPFSAPAPQFPVNSSSDRLASVVKEGPFGGSPANVNPGEPKSYANPFADMGSPEKTNEDILIKEENNADVPSDNQESGTKKIIIFIVILVLAAAFGGGGYYFWTTRNASQAPPAVPPAAPAPVVENPIEPVTPPAPKYSADNPNYLVITTSTATADTIKNLLISTGEAVIADKPAKPVEFVVTDESNSPVSLAAFLTLAGSKLPAEIINNAENNFSLFYYVDGTAIRMGMEIKAKNAATLKPLVTKNEKMLISDSAFLYLGNTPATTNVVFKSSSYNNLTVRYFNFSPDGSLSLDYIFSGNNLIFGTSKNTARAIVDKIGQ